MRQHVLEIDTAPKERPHPQPNPTPASISHPQTKHTERFAIRAKYMTVEARTNKYIHYFASIRTIQDYLCHEAAAAKVRDRARPTRGTQVRKGR